MYNNQPESPDLAILIDAQNINPKYTGPVLHHARTLGNLRERHVYGSHTITRDTAWSKAINHNNLTPTPSLAPLIAATLVAATLSTLALVALLRLPTSDPHYDLKHLAILMHAANAGLLIAHTIARHHKHTSPLRLPQTPQKCTINPERTERSCSGEGPD